ncbi:MAG: membrane protein insertion efficiency factor YidD [Acidobacteriota bacterium]|nr:membrane protein insertion efficiency factor YidD [Acidobacteriota bacterium]
MEPERAATPVAPVSSTARRRRWPWILAALALLLLLDLSRPPEAQLSAAALLGAIDLYQATLSPRMPGMGVHCRFQPTCSHYGEAVIRRDGALIGSGKALWRILRCGPWTPPGTSDPP